MTLKLDYSICVSSGEAVCKQWTQLRNPVMKRKISREERKFAYFNGKQISTMNWILLGNELKTNLRALVEEIDSVVFQWEYI